MSDLAEFVENMVTDDLVYQLPIEGGGAYFAFWDSDDDKFQINKSESGNFDDSVKVFRNSSQNRMEAEMGKLGLGEHWVEYQDIETGYDDDDDDDIGAEFDFMDERG